MIIIKTKEEIELIGAGGRILSDILDKVIAEVKPGITTGDLEEMACAMIADAGGKPSFKGYRSSPGDKPFPTALCASVNNQVVHTPALPARKLADGDIIGIDIGMEYKGLFTDMAKTVPVGEISEKAQKLIAVTKESLELAIKQVKPGNTISDIGRAVQNYAEAHGFSVVRQLVGHGVGKAVHEDPQIPNFVINKKNFKDTILKEGMVIAIEPMINAGNLEVETDRDGFTVVTSDGSLSAHFEHTIAVTSGGHRVLTRNN